MSRILDEHLVYVSDERRVGAFDRALREVIRPGDVVLDLASGTGVLGMLACRAGAGRVYSVDSGGLSGLAAELARANGFRERMVFIDGLSTRIDLPEKVDVLVADQIGRFGFEAGIIEYFNDARRRLLKPEGRTIPSQIDLLIAPVSVPKLWRQIDTWNRKPAGLDFSRARSIGVNTGHPIRIDARNLLGAPCPIVKIDLSDIAHRKFAGEVAMPIDCSGILHGLMGGFAAQLSTSVVMSNSPVHPGRIKRRNVYFPIERALEVESGETVRAEISISEAESLVMWKVELLGIDGRSKARFVHSTFHGMLLGPEDLRKTEPSFVPRLSRWGRARRTVVDLCDGTRTLEQIQTEVFRRHADIFGSIEEAEGFVAEVMYPYAL